MVINGIKVIHVHQIDYIHIILISEKVQQLKK